MQEKLPIKNLDKKGILKRAHFFIRENYGTIPSAGEPIFKKGVWNVPIHANYPRILFDEIKKQPKKVRFMGFKNLGTIEFSENGEVISNPRYYEITGTIQHKLREIRESIEKALVKVAADRFSLLTFPDHMFTPIQDILSWLIINDRLKLKEFLEKISSDKKEKYLQNIKILEDVNLIKQEKGLVLPAESLIEVEMNTKLNNVKKLYAALTIFYQRGYEHLDAITSFLGPHLIISGHVYRESIECNEKIAVKENEFKELINECYYDKSKLTKLPRYLLQLEGIEVLLPSKKKENAWEPNPSLFNKLQGEEEIIAPIQNMIIQN